MITGVHRTRRVTDLCLLNLNMIKWLSLFMGISIMLPILSKTSNMNLLDGILTNKDIKLRL